MIRKLISRVFKQGKKASGATKIIPFKEHGISREQIPPCALKVTDGLQNAGFTAFVVGGAVRDLLMGLTPKDFDVATNATPEDVRHLFRRSRIIGRRFRLVHVMCGIETIEVSTYRAAQTGEQDGRNADANGRILRDNVFGNQEEDAVRRDFTINALYYNPATQEIWDTQNGVRDIKHKTLRIIGDPEQRFREDPVRMLRAVRFAAKLDFHIEERTRAPVASLASLLENVPESRLFDEMLKLLLSGHAVRAVHQLRAEGLHHGLLPLLDTILEQPMGERFISMALKSTDDRVKLGKPVSPGFLFATLLWHEVLVAWKAHQAAPDAKPLSALQLAMDEVIYAQQKRLAIPRRYDANMNEIWGMQPRFEQRAGSRPFRLLAHPRFRAGYDFLMLRCESGEIPMELGKWWEKFQSATEQEKSDMLIADSVPKKRRRRRKSNTKPASAGFEQNGQD